MVCLSHLHGRRNKSLTYGGLQLVDKTLARDITRTSQFLTLRLRLDHLSSHIPDCRPVEILRDDRASQIRHSCCRVDNDDLLVRRVHRVGCVPERPTVFWTCV